MTQYNVPTTKEEDELGTTIIYRLRRFVALPSGASGATASSFAMVPNHFRKRSR